MKAISKIKYLRTKVPIFILIIVLSATSCGKINNCNKDCFTPPQPIAFRVMNDSVDLIYTGYYNEDSISLYYMNGDNKIDTEIFIFNDTVKEISIIHSNIITWKSVEGYRDFYLSLNSTEVEEIYLVVQSVSEDCCTFHPIMEIKINGAQPIFDNPSYSFIINKKVK